MITTVLMAVAVGRLGLTKAVEPDPLIGLVRVFAFAGLARHD